MLSPPFSPVPLEPESFSTEGERPPWRGYALAIVLVALAAAARMPFQSVLGESAPYTLFNPAVLVAACYGGLGPGMLSVALSGLAGLFLFQEPYGELSAYGHADWVRLVLFLVSGVVITMLSVALRSAWRRAELESREVMRQMRRFRESEERYRRMLEAAHEGVWACDADGRTSYVNSRLLSMLGRSLVQMVGRPVTEFVTEADRASFQSLLLPRVDGGADVRRFQLLRSDGSPVACVISGQALAGVTRGYGGTLLLVSEDATECAHPAGDDCAAPALRHTLEALRDELRRLAEQAAARGGPSDEVRRLADLATESLADDPRLRA